MKTCSKCKETKVLDCFSKQKNGKFGKSTNNRGFFEYVEGQ